MTTFLDGPAKGVRLELARAPLFLRVVHNTKTGEWDALDQLNDKPSQEELIYVYKLASQPTTGFIDFRGKGGRREGRQFVAAEYKLYVFHLEDLLTRDGAKWAEWAEMEGRRLEANGNLFKD